VPSLDSGGETNLAGTLEDVTELHVRITDDVAERLASEAAERGVTAEDLAAEVLTTHVPDAASPSPARGLSFIGLGGEPGFSPERPRTTRS